MILTIKSNLDTFEETAEITFNIGEVEVYLNKKLPSRRVSLLPGKKYTWKASVNKKWYLYPKSGNIVISKGKTITLTVGGTRVSALADSSVADAVWSINDLHCGSPPGNAIFITLTSLPIGWHNYSWGITGGSCSYTDILRTAPTPAFIEIRPNCDFPYDGVTTYTATLTVYDSFGNVMNITSHAFGPCGSP